MGLQSLSTDLTTKDSSTDAKSESLQVQKQNTPTISMFKAIFLVSRSIVGVGVLAQPHLNEEVLLFPLKKVWCHVHCNLLSNNRCYHYILSEFITNSCWSYEIQRKQVISLNTKTKKALKNLLVIFWEENMEKLRQFSFWCSICLYQFVESFSELVFVIMHFVTLEAPNVIICCFWTEWDFW